MLCSSTNTAVEISLGLMNCNLMKRSMYVCACRPDAWGGGPGAIKCAMETQPILNHTGPLYIGTDWRLHGAAEAVLRSMRRVPVHLVDITALSEFRKDAHTSVHTLRQGKLLTPEQQADPRAYADCIHWCLPGVPDIWNSLLYTRIMSRPDAATAALTAR